jgi:hypothetical protein
MASRGSHGPDEGSRESADAKCRQRTATWVRERAGRDPDIELCDWYEQLERAGEEAMLEPGVYTLQVGRGLVGVRDHVCACVKCAHVLECACA